MTTSILGMNDTRHNKKMGLMITMIPEEKKKMWREDDFIHAISQLQSKDITSLTVHFKDKDRTITSLTQQQQKINIGCNRMPLFMRYSAAFFNHYLGKS